MSWLHDATTKLLADAREAKELKAFPFMRRFRNVGTRVNIGDSSYINFTSNDYLGLSQDRRLVSAAVEGVERYGTGMGSSRLQASADRHGELEFRLARWLDFAACAVFPSGYQAIVGLLSTYLDDDCCVVIDRLSHACIIDGCLMALGQNPDMEMRTFKHNNAKALARILSRTEKKKKLVVVEGLYSVDGDLAPLPELIEVCHEHGAPIVVDDAHGLGAIGPTGRGVAELQGCLGDVDIMFGTFSKSFGGIGGFILGDRAIIDYLKLRARSFVFSAALPVGQVNAAIAALDIIEADGPKLVEQLAENGALFREGLLRLGFDLGDSDTHILPIMVREEKKAFEFAAYLYHGAKVIMMPFVSPGVPPGQERLRCNVTAAHSKADMGYTLEALATIGPMLDLLPSGVSTGASTLQKGLWLAETKLRGVRNAGLPYLRSEIEAATEKVGAWTRKLFNGHNNT
ncbi:MAG: aminotransferase class I/II-fold pyridoxal phosphate-dependent enzyme [Myxococcales bacterium]|nr:aminotransferase class I/II-fold pyridoxal phosphate-dependent enzyme [Myxococcales bacterium]